MPPRWCAWYGWALSGLIYKVRCLEKQSGIVAAAQMDSESRTQLPGDTQFLTVLSDLRVESGVVGRSLTPQGKIT